MKINNKISFTEKTHEGATASRMTPEQALSRSVCSCLLWENQFYENGELIADRIIELSKQVSVDFLISLAIHVRKDLNIRHAPLILLLTVIEQGKGRIVSEAINAVVSRPDELCELLALYWNRKKRELNNLSKVKQNPKQIDNQLKKGLAKAFTKFDAYQLAKYNRNEAIKLRDVMFLCHPKPKNEDMSKVYNSLANGKLASPDTWEVALSTGKDKKETFERLIKENKLGYLALLRNLRGMLDAKVEIPIIEKAILDRKGADKVLPFRFISAARAAPQLDPVLDTALLRSLDDMEPFSGKTIILVDVSGSMYCSKISSKSDLTCSDAAAALASIIPGKRRVFTFSEKCIEVGARKGLAGIDIIHKSQKHERTYLGHAIEQINKENYDRVIVITDEQSADSVPNPKGKFNYLVNVQSNQNGISYKNNWVHLDGFSENILKFISKYEKQ